MHACCVAQWTARARVTTWCEDEIHDKYARSHLPLCQDELPLIERDHDGRVLHISALILVERNGQKRILIGDKGERIKLIGKEARLDMERMFDTKVMLNLWVKIKSGWSDDERALQSLGYDGLE